MAATDSKHQGFDTKLARPITGAAVGDAEHVGRGLLLRRFGVCQRQAALAAHVALLVVDHVGEGQLGSRQALQAVVMNCSSLLGKWTSIS